MRNIIFNNNNKINCFNKKSKPILIVSPIRFVLFFCFYLRTNLVLSRFTLGVPVIHCITFVAQTDPNHDYSISYSYDT